MGEKEWKGWAMTRDESNVSVTARPVSSVLSYSRRLLSTQLGILFILHIDSFSDACWLLRL